MFIVCLFLYVSLPGFSLFAWMRQNGVGSLPLSKPMAARVKDTLEVTRFYNVQQCDQQGSLYNPHTEQWNLGMFCSCACFNPTSFRMAKIPYNFVILSVIGLKPYSPDNSIQIMRYYTITGLC